MNFVGIVGARARFALRRHGSEDKRTAAGRNGLFEHSGGLGEWQYVDASDGMAGSLEEDDIFVFVAYMGVV